MSWNDVWRSCVPAQRRYNQFLTPSSTASRHPAGMSPRFHDHVEAFERIQNADTEGYRHHRENRLSEAAAVM